MLPGRPHRSGSHRAGLWATLVGLGVSAFASTLWASPTSASHLSDSPEQKTLMVLRVYFSDYAASSRYNQSQVQGFFAEIRDLWRNISYGAFDVQSVVSSLYQLPNPRSSYIDDLSGGDLSQGAKFLNVLNDAIANAPSGLNWTGVDGVFVLMAETSSTQFHRGQGKADCNLPLGPSGPTTTLGCAIGSENPNNNNLQVWGRWMHESGHTFQQVYNPPHPSNYNSEFELMDASYPGHVDVFQKQAGHAFSGWLPESKYQVFTPESGGGSTVLWAVEYNHDDRTNVQAARVEISPDFYYLLSAHRRVLGDQLNGDFQTGNASQRGIPSEGVLIERVVEQASQWVTVKGKNNTRNQLWQSGDRLDVASDGVHFQVYAHPDNDSWSVQVSYDDQSNRPDVMINPWRTPPGNTWETTDIWVDSPVNGYGTYRYGTWADGMGGTVPRLVGDDPAIGQENRLYARVRNIGSAPATDVDVTWEIISPAGGGIAGDNGWETLGGVDSSDFSSLSSIPAGGSADVYMTWIPDVDVPAEALADGRFRLHTCIRVLLAAVDDETVLGNQDGDGEQENINYFEVPAEEEDPAELNTTVTLRNDDPDNSKFFYLYYDPDLPAGWDLDVNGGVLGLALEAGEVRELPVRIQPLAGAAAGSTFTVDLVASSLRELVSDMDPNDKHAEFDLLGGVRLQAAVLDKSVLYCEAHAESGGRVYVNGALGAGAQGSAGNGTLSVLLEGVDANRSFLPATARLVRVATNGTFEGFLNTTKGSNVREATCLFAGTTTSTAASSGYVPLGNATGANLTVADLSVTKNASASSVAAGGKFTYTVTITNRGPDAARGVHLKESLPNGTELLNASFAEGSKGACGGNVTLVCKLSTLKSGASATVTLLVRATGAGNVTNTVQVGSTSLDPDLLNNVASATVGIAGPPAPTTGTTTPGVALPATLALGGVAAAMLRARRRR